MTTRTSIATFADETTPRFPSAPIPNPQSSVTNYQLPVTSYQSPLRGFTLVELLIGAAILVTAIVALLGAFLGQVTLNEHARNLTWAVNDANRVMEQVRQQNSGSGCTTPTAVPPSSAGCPGPPAGTCLRWDQWLASTTPGTGGGGKSVQPSPNVNELIVVTCQDQDGGAAASDHCERGSQVGTGEWTGHPDGTATTFDPIRLTVAVCWRHRGRVLGECTWNGATLQANDADGDGVIESSAMLSTLMTCRQ